MKDGYTVNWLKRDGSADHHILTMRYDGAFTWAQWLQNEVKIKNLLDGIEAEYQQLDKRTGTFNTVGMIVDVGNIDFSLIKPLSILPQASDSFIYTHPRAGEIVVIGLEKDRTTFASEMVKLMFDVFTKAFPRKTGKVHRAKDLDEAITHLKYSY